MNNIEIRMKNKIEIAITNLILFNFPEWKFNSGNLGYFILEIIKNDELIIMGNKKRGSEYSGAIVLILSIYSINEHINIALKVVGRPSK